MDWWVIGLVANAVVAVAYFGICAAIVVPLVRSHQLRSNPLGGATAAIFFTCAVHHGTHSFHMLMPAFGLDLDQGNAMRDAWGWQLAVWDVIGALVGVYYWTLRRNYGSLMEGAQLFEDMRRREEQALELNDNVLQGLVVAKMSLDLGDQRRASEALKTAIGSASHMITDLLGPDRRGSSDRLLRGSAAVTAPHPETGPAADNGSDSSPPPGPR
jgi:hypothetical protein